MPQANNSPDLKQAASSNQIVLTRNSKEKLAAKLNKRMQVATEKKNFKGIDDSS